MSTLKLENIKHENSSTNNMVMDSDGSTRTTGIHKVNSRLQVGNSSITQGYPQTNFGYVADFQASAGTQTYISIATPQTASLGSGGVVIGEDATDTYITQRGNKNIKLATQDLARINIDGSGRVTKPYQPSFQAYGASQWQTVTSGNTQVIALNVAHSNIGSHYDTSTYRFTAPVAGQYLFSINCYCRLETHDDDSNHAYVFLRKNGATYINAIAIYGYYNSGDVDQTQNVCCLMTMAAGDYATAELNAASGDASAYRGATTFSGFLVG